MNAVEIEEAITALAERPFDAAEFSFSFLEAFGNKETTIKRLRKGESNKSDLGGVLQTNNIHIKVASAGEVTKTLASLKESRATTRFKAQFILATDGDTFEAEDLESGETVACNYQDFPDHFGFFLPLAGISTVKQVRESSFDIRATSRLNRLYVQLLKDNPAWGTADRRHDMNHFMARLIFCFFAEDTDILHPSYRFTDKVEMMSARDSSNTHEVIETIFRSMNTRPEEKDAAGIPRWADGFPYVNGGLFSGDMDVPRFSKIARSYLIHIGKLDWTKINPDIFGSMIQAVADDEERGALGMHYTSVPNILKVLNPLFLDDLHAKLEEAGTNKRKLQNLRQRLGRIRIFDPACGSGNFLVIAYKQLREIERRIQVRLADGADTLEALLDTFNYPGDRSVIPLTNFRGIELRDFPAEIARLALIIAEYQCDVLYRGQKLALAEFLPLDAENWITCGNALRIDWIGVCPPTGTGVKLHTDDLLQTPLDQTQIDFENQGGEIHICSNPPYLGNKLQTNVQKAELEAIFGNRTDKWKSLDYVAAWFMKASDFARDTGATAALVATNSVCQGQQVPILWPLIFSSGQEIKFAHTSFKWRNLASSNAGVTVAIVGIGNAGTGKRTLYSVGDDGQAVARSVDFINAYLAPAANIIVEATPTPVNGLPQMMFGNMPRDDGHLLLDIDERRDWVRLDPGTGEFLKDLVGSEDAIHGKRRACIWVSADQYERAAAHILLRERFQAVERQRRLMKAASTQAFAAKPYRFVQIQGTAARHSFIVPRHSSESRPYLPVCLFTADTIVADSAFAVYDAPLWALGLLISRLHLIWIASVCGKLETRYRYSNTLGWNTFPVPPLTDKNKADLTRCAEDILLAREHYFPAVMADMYDPDRLDVEFPLVREAHERNDEVLERIYIGRRFKNDTERLEKLFELYTKMTAKPHAAKSKRRGGDV